MDDMDSDDVSRVRSLGTEEVEDLFRSERFPMTTEELIEEFGDSEIDYPRGSERLESILRTSGKETYETLDELQLALLNGVGRDAVGRPRYSERGRETTQEFERMDRSF